MNEKVTIRTWDDFYGLQRGKTRLWAS